MLYLQRIFDILDFDLRRNRIDKQTISIQQNKKPSIFSEEKKAVLYQVFQKGYNFSNLSSEWRNDRDVALAAVSNYGWAIQFFNENLRRDEELVKIAISNSGCAVNYVREYFGKNKEIGLLAVAQDGNAIFYLDEELQDDKDIIEAALFQNNYLICFQENWSKDWEIAMTLIVYIKESKGDVINYINHELLARRDFVLEANLRSGNFIKQIEWLPSNLKEQIEEHIRNTKIQLKNPYSLGNDVK